MWPDRRTLVLSALIVIAAVFAAFLLYSRDNGEPAPSPPGSTSDTGFRPSTTRHQATTTAPTSSTTAPTSTTWPGQQPLAVTEQGFTARGDYGTYGAVISNPNPNLAATKVAIDVVFTDASHTVVGQQSDYIELLPPGQTSGVGGSLHDLSGTTTTMQVTVKSAEFVPSSAKGTVTIDGVSLSAHDGGMTTTGTAHNTFATGIDELTVVALYRDAGGRIVGGDTGFADPLSAGGSAEFEINGLDEVPNVASATVLASLPIELLGN